MVEEKIAEAADALARKQLGLDKKTEAEKEEKMPAMFVQISNVFNLELMEQLNKISANMMQKYDLKKISSETLGIIAEKIKEEVEDGKIQSISELSQNKEILIVAEHATIIQKEKEYKISEEDLEKIPVEELNYVEELRTEKISPMDKTMIDLWKLTETKSKILEVAEGTTLENLSEKIAEIKTISSSEEAKREKKENDIENEEILLNGTKEQRKVVERKIDLEALTEERKSLTGQEQLENKTIIRVMIFDYMKEFGKIANNPNLPEETFKSLKATLIMALATDCGISEKNKVNIMNSNSAKEIIGVLSEELADICIEDGHPANLVDPKQFEKLAIRQSGSGLYKNGATSFEAEERTSITYATAFLSPHDKKNLKSLLKQLKSDQKDAVYDFDILDKIKFIDKNLYYSMIRNIGNAAQKTNNPMLKGKFEELVENEAQKELYDQIREGLIKRRLERSPEEQKATRRDLVSIFYNQMRGLNFSNKSLDVQKREIIGILRRENALSSEEKDVLIEKIENVKGKQELSEILVDKMDEIFCQETGKKLDKEDVLKRSKKQFKASETYKMKARAKLIFDESTYRKYEIFIDSLITKKFDENADYKILPTIKKQYPKMYENIIGLMKNIYDKSKDEEQKKRMRLFLNVEDLEVSEKEIRQNQMQSNIKNVINERNALKEQHVEGKSTTKASLKLFELITKVYDPKNNNETSFEKIKEEAYKYISSDMSFSEKEVEELLNQIALSSSNGDLGYVFAKKMVELSESRGIEKNGLKIAQIIDLAERRTQHKFISENVKYDRASIIMSRAYAKMFLAPNERNEVRKLIDVMGHPNVQEKYDFSILDRVKSVDESFYYSMIRSIGIMATKTKKPELMEKYDQLFANELMDKGYNDLDILGKNDLKAKIMFDEDIYCRYNDLVSSIKEGNAEGIYDEGMLEYLQKKAPQIYSVLISEVKNIAKNRNDQGLFKLLEKTEAKDQQESNKKEENYSINNAQIISVQNITIDEIVVSHSQGLDIFAPVDKSAQSVEDVDDGR